MVGAAEIVDRASLMRWLEALPQNGQLWVSEAIASRSALRVVPLIARVKGISVDHLSGVLKDCFRENIFARCPRKQMFASIGGYVAAGDDQGNVPSIGYVVVEAARAASSHSISGCVFATEFASNAVYSALDSSFTDKTKAADIWAEVRKDAAFVESGGTDLELHSRPIWVTEPFWWKQELQSLEGLLKTQRLFDEEGWDIWLDWYRSVARGFPAFNLKSPEKAEDLERKIAILNVKALEGKIATSGSNPVRSIDRIKKQAQQNLDLWDREPAAINADIKAWVDEARTVEREDDRVPQAVVDDLAVLSTESESEDATFTAVPLNDFPEQSLDAPIFGLTEAGQVDRLPVPPEQRLLITAVTLQEYGALREDAAKLSGLGQILGKLGPELDKLLAAMPEDMTHAEVFSVWRAINRLRRTMNAHTAVASDPDPHEAKLERSIAEELGLLLDSANNFAFADPGLRKRDENVVPPQDRPSVEDEKRLGDALIQIVINTPDLLTPQARDVIKAEEDNAENAGKDAHGFQAVDQANKTRRNVFAEVLSSLRKAARSELVFAWKEVRGGAYKATGAAAITFGATDYLGTTAVYHKIWTVIFENLSPFLNYAAKVYQNPAVTKLLEDIAKLAH